MQLETTLIVQAEELHIKQAKLQKIQAAIEQADPSKVLDVEVLIKESDSLLRPCMTVSCEFLVADVKDVFFVRSSCIHRDEGEFGGAFLEVFLFFGYSPLDARFNL